MLTNAQVKEFLVKLNMQVADVEKLVANEKDIFLNYLAYTFGEPLHHFAEFLAVPNVHPGAEAYVLQVLNGDHDGKSLVESIHSFFGHIGDKVEAMIEGAGQQVEEMAEAASDGLEELSEDIGEVVDTVGEKLEAAAEVVMDSVEGALNSVANVFSEEVPVAVKDADPEAPSQEMPMGESEAPETEAESTSLDEAVQEAAQDHQEMAAPKHLQPTF